MRIFGSVFLLYEANAELRNSGFANEVLGNYHRL